MLSFLLLVVAFFLALPASLLCLSGFLRILLFDSLLLEATAERYQLTAQVHFAHRCSL